jgi:hypothetical protein
MIDEHRGQFAIQELPTLAELCTKHTLETNKTQCPCCGESTDDSDYFYRHLAKHLQDIATLSLMPNLSCTFSTNADSDLQLADAIPSKFDQESSVQSTGPLQQYAGGRAGDRDTQGTLRRTHSVPTRERDLGTGSHGKDSSRDISDEPVRRHDFIDIRRHSFNSLQKPTRSLAIHPYHPKSRRSEDSLDADSSSGSVISADETPSWAHPPSPEPSELREDQYHTPHDDQRTFEIDEKVLRAIFSPEAGYQDLKIFNDDSGPVCFVEFESIVSAFRAAYKLNHYPMLDSEATRLAIAFTGRKFLSVRVAAGPPLSLPLLEAVEQYWAPVEIVPMTKFEYLKQGQDHGQTDQSSRETEAYAHGFGSFDFPSD